MAGTNLSSRDGQLGPGLIGAFATLILFGILTAQTYAYYRNYPKDYVGNKVIVGLVWILDTLNVAVMCHAAYFYLVKNYGNPNPFQFAVWSLVATLMLNILVAFVVQAYFSLRIHDVSGKKWWLTCVVALLVTGHVATGMYNVVQLFVNRNIGLLDGITLGSAIPWAAFSVVSDIAISGALCWLLASKRTGFKDTNTLIDSLMIYAINRCLLTVVIAILEVICFVALPDSLAFIGVDLVTGKLYSNSLLATLNSRISLQQRSLKGSMASHSTSSGPTMRFTSNMTVGGLTTETAEMFGVTIPEQDSRDSRVLDLYHRNNGRRALERSTNTTRGDHDAHYDIEEKIIPDTAPRSRALSDG